MADISWRTATDWVSLQLTAVQAALTQTIDTSVGSVALALAEACTSVALWLQSEIVQVLALTRAATSSGADLDTFVEPFGFVRAPATLATGTVTLSRATPAQIAIVPVGSQVSTGPGGLIFSITADNTNAAYSDTAVPATTTTAALPGYTLPIGTASITVPILAATAGTAGNVQADTIQSFVQGVAGVDSVTNPSPLSNGVDQQTDDNARLNFKLYMTTRSRATRDAIAFAISQVHQNLTYAIHVNQNEAGAVQPGHFVVYLDDGTGTPPDSLLTAVYNSVDAYRALAETFSVQRPTVLLASVSMVLQVSAGYQLSIVSPAVSNAISAYINSLEVERALSFNRLSAVAFNAHPAVAGITGLVLNGGTIDIGGAPGQVVRTGAISID